MRTVDYSEILYGSAALAGFGPADLGAPEFASFRTFHDRRLQVAWEIMRWPDLCPVEQRQYRANYSASATYGAASSTPNTDNSANEVYDLPTGYYFQSLIAGNTGNAPTLAGVENSAFWAQCQTSYATNDWLTATAYAVGNQVRDPSTGLYWQCITAHTSGGTFSSTNWGLLTPFNKYIAYQQTGQTAIGEILKAFDKDPRITTQLRKFPFWLSPDGVQFTSAATAVVWIYFRTRRPTLKGNAWDSTAAYSANDQVYFAAVSGGSGNFYTATGSTTAGQSPVTNPSLWTVVQLPYFLRGYLIQGGFADWLMSDGQAEKAESLEGQATQYLELEADKVQRQEQQVARFTLG